MGTGLFVEWTSVIRGAAVIPTTRMCGRRTQRMSFVPSGNPGVFNAIGAQDPRSPEGLGWTSINERTLTVHVMRIHASGRICDPDL